MKRNTSEGMMARRLTGLTLCFALMGMPTALALAQSGSASPADEFNQAVFFGKKFFTMGQYAPAYEQYARADSIFPDQPGVLYNLAVVLFKLDRYSEAQVKIDRYLQLYPRGEELPAVSNLQLELAFRRELQRTMQATQDYAELFNRGKFLFSKGDVEGALKVFREAEEQRSDDPAVVYNQALAYEVRGEFVKATERLRRYLELNQNAGDKAAVDQKIFALESELEDMRTKIVCAFCGFKLPVGSPWCHRCWHGPYLTSSARWNSRPCGSGASTTRTTVRADGTVHKNEDLPCQLRDRTYLEALRYSPSRQQAIQQARKTEGWTYAGDMLQQWADQQGNELKLEQGAESLEKVRAPVTGEVLEFTAHRGSQEVWFLDREDVIMEGQKFTKRYSFDGNGRISQEAVRYQTPLACNYVITVTADYAYQNDELSQVRFKGEYDGFQAEGAPATRWDGVLNYTFDDQRRILKEDFAVTSHSKTYKLKAEDKHREEIAKLHKSMRLNKPVDLLRSGDLCALRGTVPVGNAIDLRPFYTLSPNLGVVLPFGVTRLTVSFTYPE